MPKPPSVAGRVDIQSCSPKAELMIPATYADYIPGQQAENPLPEPVAPVGETNVVDLFG
jgi:hypothetical protein